SQTRNASSATGSFDRGAGSGARTRCRSEAGAGASSSSSPLTSSGDPSEDSQSGAFIGNGRFFSLRYFAGSQSDAQVAGFIFKVVPLAKPQALTARSPFRIIRRISEPNSQPTTAARKPAST